jgi:translation initiation factor 2 subunit beta (aeIF-2b)
MDYDEQLNRALAETPDVAEEGHRFELPTPDIHIEGNRTVWENFETTCDRLARKPNHIVRYLQSELGTSALIDDKGRARAWARFTGGFS